MPPLVSILIPAYNAERWISEAIHSALAQTWRPVEIIVIDDGSRDATFSVMRRFESASVRVITRENRGASATRNEALALSQGDYIQWLDADDLLHPDKVAIQMGAAERCGPAVLLAAECGHFHFRPARTRYVPGPLWRTLTPVEWLQTKMESNSFIAINAWLMSRRLCERAGPWDASLSADDDGDYLSRVVTAAERIEFVPGARAAYRIANPQSLSHVKRSPAWLRSQFTSISRQVVLLRRLEDSERSRRACLQLLQATYFLFYPDQVEIVRRAQALAAELGGELQAPDVRPKYRWIRQAFGWKAARAAQDTLPAARAWCVRSWDRCLAACGL